ncbi:hypothetical protein ABPG74_019833 [Tetrahymena malaccensis]
MRVEKEMLTQQQINIVNSLFKELSKEFFAKKDVIQALIENMKERKLIFELLDYLGDLIQSMVLKPKNYEEKRHFTQKLLEHIHYQLKNDINQMKKELKLLKKSNYNQYLVQALDYFYLFTSEPDKEEKEVIYRANQDILSLVLEMKICKHILKNLFDEIIKTKSYPNQQGKEKTAIQNLDVLNQFYSQNFLQRNIKPVQYLINYERINMIFDLGFGSILRKSQSQKKKMIVEEEAQNEKVHQDNHSFRLIQRKKSTKIQCKLQCKGLPNNKLGSESLLKKSKPAVSIYNAQMNDYGLKNISQCKYNKQKNRLKQKVNIQKNCQQKLNVDFSCTKMKLLGGSDNQKKQDSTQNDQTVKKNNKPQVNKFNFNLNEDRHQTQLGEQNNIEMNSSNQINEQVSHKVNLNTMIIKELNSSLHSQQQEQQTKQKQLNNYYINDYLVKQNKIDEVLDQGDFDNLKVDYQELHTMIKHIIQQYQIYSKERKNIELKTTKIIQQEKVEVLKQNQEGDSNCESANKINNERLKLIQDKCNSNKKQIEENKIIQLEDLITKADKSKQILRQQDLCFLESIFKLGYYLTSGGEADIFVNIEKQVAFRVIKIDEDDSLSSNLSELHNIKQFQEREFILDLQASHLIENKINKQKYIIHVMQICQASLAKECQKVAEYSLDQILNITFTCLHYLIQLRQKYIYHQDIKLANILKINDQYKLSDFGASKIINVNNPFIYADMYTEYYKPKHKINENLPFYHDIYSVAKTIQYLLNKLKKHEAIKDELHIHLKEILKDDQSSIKIDCFQLPQKFIDCLIDKLDLEAKEFLEKFLIQIEEYLVINKENKIFKYESQFQYAEIALKILKIENLNENIQKNKIKLKALQTKSYILFKRGKYQETFLCIKEILINQLYEKNPLDVLISSIIIITKILIKINQISFNSEVYQNLMEFIRANENNKDILLENDNQFLELEIILFDLQLNSSSTFQPIQSNFYDLLEKIDENKRLEIIYKLTIKYLKYLKRQNAYDDSIDEVIKYIIEDQTNNTSYYQQKLIIKMCSYLYQFFIKKEKLDFDFYVKYQNQIQNLVQIVFNFLITKQDEKFEICFDQDIQGLLLILKDIKESKICEFAQTKTKEIEKLIQKYKDQLDFENNELTQNDLYYEEQNHYFKIKRIFRQKYENLNQNSNNKQNDSNESADFFSESQYQIQEKTG